MSQKQLPPLPSLPPGVYTHYRGGQYEVIGLCRHSETLEPMVVYRHMKGERDLWVRPFAMFVENVEHNGKTVQRFQKI